PGEVTGHEVNVVSEVFPGAAHPRHLRLAAELAFGADFPRHARHLASEGVELVHHNVESVFQFEDFALDVHPDLARQVAARHRGGAIGDFAHLPGEVTGHRVNVVGEVFPGAGHARHLRLAAEFAVGADFAGDAGHFRGERVELVHHRINGV